MRKWIVFILIMGSFTFAEAKECVFCNQRIMETQSVYEGDHFKVLVDHEPRVRGHLLVVSKRHVSKAHELSSKEWEELSQIVPKVVSVFSEFLHTDQYVVLEKNGPNAFQQVPHVHFHFFPVTTQTWADIFNVAPRRLEPYELEEEAALFRFRFSSIPKDPCPECK